MDWLFDSIKGKLIDYFAKNICPNRFSLTSSEAKENDFYEVHIYIPDGNNSEIAQTPKNHRGALRVLFEFIPTKPKHPKFGYIEGICKKREDADFSSFYLSKEFIRFARIDVHYYFGLWVVREDTCSLYTLIRLFILRAFGGIYIEMGVQKLVRYFRNRKISKRLQTPLKSKFEIYEALMGSDSFLRLGTFKKSELSSLIFGKHSSNQFSIYQKVSQSLNWVLEACIEDGEVEQVADAYGSSDDPIYKVKGKGIHYFTLTKENIKREEENKIIQKQQVKIQNRMVLLTFLLVIGTFLTATDKVSHISKAYGQAVEFTSKIIEFLIKIIT